MQPESAAASVAKAVVRCAREQKLGRVIPDDEIDRTVDSAIWNPRYVPYDPFHVD